MNKEKQHCGFIMITGRPNVGKSTLLNKLLGQKVSITSRKPYTTRHRIMGIKTEGIYQAIYIDTPGLYFEEKNNINCTMNRLASSFITDVELIIFVIEGTNWTTADQMVLRKLSRLKYPVLLAINKVDIITNKSIILSHIMFLNQQMRFFDIVPISAEKGININTITSLVHKLLPQATHRFPSNYITDCSKNFIASEIIREKIMRFLGKEVPYSVIIKIKDFIQNESGNYNINGLILVEREGQKKIIIGKKGAKIKTIGITSRQDMERIFGVKLHLELWVKVKSSWKDNVCTIHG